MKRTAGGRWDYFFSCGNKRRILELLLCREKIVLKERRCWYCGAGDDMHLQMDRDACRWRFGCSSPSLHTWPPMQSCWVYVTLSHAEQLSAQCRTTVLPWVPSPPSRWGSFLSPQQTWLPTQQGTGENPEQQSVILTPLMHVPWKSICDNGSTVVDFL